MAQLCVVMVDSCQPSQVIFPLFLNPYILTDEITPAKSSFLLFLVSRACGTPPFILNKLG